jgi:glycosyltransferase involved in cell wall biosynthesis
MAVIGHLPPSSGRDGTLSAAAFNLTGDTPPQLSAANISVVVPVGGAARDWPRAARSLGRFEPPPGEIIVVIDGVNQQASETAASIGATVIELDQRGGPARARNLGAHAAGGEIVLFLDADIEAPSDLPGRIARIFVERPELTAVMGSYDARPGDPGMVSQYRNLLHHFIHQAARERASTFWTGCGAIRRTALLEAGGFDERYREPAIEDIELGVRLVRAGHAIRLEKTLQVTHLKRWRLGEMLATDLWRRAVPWNELMLSERQTVNDLNVRTLDRLSVVVAFLALAAFAGTWRSLAFTGAGLLGLGLIVALNASFFSLLARRKGALFALQAVPLYWLYLLVCGVGFLFGVSRHLLGARG